MAKRQEVEKEDPAPSQEWSVRQGGGGMLPNVGYAGMAVYTSDGEKVGRVKKSQKHGGLAASEYLIVDRRRARDIPVPASVPRVSGDHLVLPFGMSLVEGAWHVGLSNRVMSSEERRLLDSYYRLWSGSPGQDLTRSDAG